MDNLKYCLSYLWIGCKISLFLIVLVIVSVLPYFIANALTHNEIVEMLAIIVISLPIGGSLIAWGLRETDIVKRREL